MKKLSTLALICLLFLSVASCKNKSETKQEAVATTQYTLDKDQIKVQWTAYKTSEKVPVKGVFQTVNINSETSGDTPLDAIKNVEFAIPVSSIFSKDSIRDGKLQTFFFNVMANTTALSGKVKSLENNKGVVAVNMNGITKDLSVTYKLENNNITISGTMALDQWNATDALASLNEACKELHTGADGVSKTWNEVDIEVSLSTKTK